MSALSRRLRDTAEWIERTRDGPGLRDLIARRLDELAEHADRLEQDAEQMKARLQSIVPEDTEPVALRLVR